jgi:hypothetical protein
MCQISVYDFEYAGQRKQAHQEPFLIKRVMPWSGGLTEPYYLKAGGDRKLQPLETLVWQTATRFNIDSVLNRPQPDRQGQAQNRIPQWPDAGHQASVRLCERTFSRTDEEKHTTDHAICPLEPVDGSGEFCV